MQRTRQRKLGIPTSSKYIIDLSNKTLYKCIITTNKILFIEACNNIRYLIFAKHLSGCTQFPLWLNTSDWPRVIKKKSLLLILLHAILLQEELDTLLEVRLRLNICYHRLQRSPRRGITLTRTPSLYYKLRKNIVNAFLMKY